MTHRACYCITHQSATIDQVSCIWLQVLEFARTSNIDPTCDTHVCSKSLLVIMDGVKGLLADFKVLKRMPGMANLC